MAKEHRAPFSVSKANREKKVARWKAIGKFKKAQRREVRESAAGDAPAIPLPSTLPEQLRRPKKQRADASQAPRSAEDFAWQKRQKADAKLAEEKAEVEARKRAAAEKKRAVRRVLLRGAGCAATHERVAARCVGGARRTRRTPTARRARRGGRRSCASARAARCSSGIWARRGAVGAPPP